MRVNGRGSIIALNGKGRYKCRKWRLYLSTECGQKTRVITGTWTDAQKALEAFKAELADKVPASSTFAAYAASWLAYRQNLGTLAPGTLANNQREIAAILRAPIADLELSTITPQACKESLIWIKQHPQRKGSPLSNTTMNKLYITMHAIFEQAAEDEVIARNPMRRIKPPKPDTKEKQALTPDELLALIASLSTLPLDGRTMALYFICFLGLRRSEALALAAEDVDETSVHVHRAVKERNGSIAAPKSAAGIRTLPTPEPLARKVDEWRAIRSAWGFEHSQTLCCNSRGKVLLPQNLQRWWTGDSKHIGVRESLGCEGITLHQLRHSNLSMMARYMSPYDLQRYAGWSSIEPAKIYVHDDITLIKQAINRIGW